MIPAGLYTRGKYPVLIFAAASLVVALVAVTLVAVGLGWWPAARMMLVADAVVAAYLAGATWGLP